MQLLHALSGTTGRDVAGTSTECSCSYNFHYILSTDGVKINYNGTFSVPSA